LTNIIKALSNQFEYTMRVSRSVCYYDTASRGTTKCPKVFDLLCIECSSNTRCDQLGSDVLAGVAACYQLPMSTGNLAISR
jgi:hypothetical protein